MLLNYTFDQGSELLSNARNSKNSGGNYMQEDSRPVFLNLFQIRLPLPGIVSFAHRVSGILLVLAMPLVLYMLMLSLRAPDDFRSVLAWLHSPLFAIILFCALWSFWHHLLSGIRFLLLDVDIGLGRMVSRQSASVVLVAGILAAILSLLGILL
jgi:succinate dehydrogenase / fumarate reductase cytochrome b subunit